MGRRLRHRRLGILRGRLEIERGEVLLGLGVLDAQLSAHVLEIARGHNPVVDQRHLGVDRLLDRGQLFWLGVLAPLLDAADEHLHDGLDGLVVRLVEFDLVLLVLVHVFRDLGLVLHRHDLALLEQVLHLVHLALVRVAFPFCLDHHGLKPIDACFDAAVELLGVVELYLGRVEVHQHPVQGLPLRLDAPGRANVLDRRPDPVDDQRQRFAVRLDVVVVRLEARVRQDRRDVAQHE
mmetsp:Transcript_12578/g.29595  ORF Transcript_12578/g.29595 Transcript_12578/m.29595 type:complete len:236 (+) Transcript_12578:279-986(+)